MRSTQARSSEDRRNGDAKRDRDTLWSGYNPYFPPVKPEGAQNAQPSTVPFDPYFPARHRH